MYKQIDSNKRRTIALMFGFIVIVALFGWILSRATGNPIMVLGLTIFAVIYATISYFASASITLAIAGAKPVAKNDAPELYRVVENLVITAGLPLPRIYIINDPSPNAFATGRDPQHAVVAVTSGLLDIMTKAELEGVVGHELSHVDNYDIRLMAMVVVLVGILTMVSNFFLRFSFFGGRDDNEGGGDGNAIFMVVGIIMAIVAPITATIIQLAISRNREYLADASGVLLTRYPEGLASALAKISQAGQPLAHANTATAHLYLASPFKAAGGKIVRLFDTHPPIQERIKRLQEMEGSGGN